MYFATTIFYMTLKSMQQKLFNQKDDLKIC